MFVDHDDKKMFNRLTDNARVMVNCKFKIAIYRPLITVILVRRRNEDLLHIAKHSKWGPGDPFLTLFLYHFFC